MQFRRPALNVARPENYILANVAEAEFRELNRTLVRVDLAQGFRFAGPGDMMPFVYFLLGGLVSVDALTRSGESIEVSVTGNEGVIGTCALLGQVNRMHAVVMQVPGQALRAPVGPAQELLRASGHFTDLVYEHIALQMLQMGQAALCNRLHGIKSRLARWLLTAFDRTGTEHLALTQEFLSQMLGARRSTVTTMAGELQRAGLIRYSRGKIVITNRRGLEGEACECYGLVGSAYRKALMRGRE